MKYAKYLMHYNHNHDKLGRFARSNGSGGGISNRDLKKLRKDDARAGKKNRKTLNRDRATSLAKAALEDDVKKKELEYDLIKASQKRNNLEEEHERITLREGKKASPKLENDLRKAIEKEEEAYDRLKQRKFEITDEFLDRYADATIKDLKLNDNQEVKDFIVRNATEGWYDSSIFELNTIRTQFMEDKTERQKQRAAAVSKNR